MIRPQTNWLKFLSHLAPILLSFLLLGLSIWAIGQELRKYDIQEVWDSLRAIPYPYLVIALFLTLLNYGILTSNDVLALYYVNHPLPYRKTAFVAVIGYAISNSVGFALLSGGAIRYRFYSIWGLSPGKIASIVTFSNLGFWIGLFAVGGVLFVFDPRSITDLVHLPFDSVHPLGAIFLALLLGYLLWSAFWRRSLKIGTWVLPRLSFHLSLAQILFTALDWGIAAAIFYLLLPSRTPLSFLGLFEVYMLAQIAGLISHIPGGLGVFETVMLLLLSPNPVPSAALFGTIIAYRSIFYLLPLLIALLMLGFYELQRRLIPKPPLR